MSLLLDGILLAVMAVCVISGVRNGFIKSFMGLIKGIVSILTAYAYTPVIRDTVKGNYIIRGIADGIAETLKSLALNLESQIPSYDLSKVAADLPEAYTNILERYNINAEEFTAQIAGITAADESLIFSFSEQIADPCATAVASVVSFIGIFVVVFVGLSLVTWVLDALFHLPVLSSANRFFGLLLGLLEGLLFAYVISNAGSVLMTALGSMDSDLFGGDVIEKTVLCRFFLEYNVLGKILEVMQ